MLLSKSLSSISRRVLFYVHLLGSEWTDTVWIHVHIILFNVEYCCIPSPIKINIPYWLGAIDLWHPHGGGLANMDGGQAHVDVYTEN